MIPPKKTKLNRQQEVLSRLRFAGLRGLRFASRRGAPPLARWRVRRRWWGMTLPGFPQQVQGETGEQVLGLDSLESVYGTRWRPLVRSHQERALQRARFFVGYLLRCVRTGIGHICASELYAGPGKGEWVAQRSHLLLLGMLP